MKITKSVFICSSKHLPLGSKQIMECFSENKDNLIFAYALRSCFSITDTTFRTLTCDQGTAYILSNILEVIKSDQDDTSTILFILIPRSSLLRIDTNTDHLIRTKISDCAALRILSGYANLLIKDLHELTYDLVLQAEFHFSDLVIAAISYCVKKTASPQKLKGQAKLDSIKRYIAKNLSWSKLSLEFVASHAGITPRYVRYLFDKEGVCFTAYVLEQRLIRAHELLLSNHFAARSITDVAYECGFNELSYFNRTFKRRFKEIPSVVSKRSGLVQTNN